jgi:hypothetical protein
MFSSFITTMLSWVASKSTTFVKKLCKSMGSTAGSYFENFILTSKFLMLPLGGLYVKNGVQRGIWVPTQHLLRDQRKLWKTLIELAGRRTFRMQTDF